MNTATDSAVYERTIAIDASPETVWEFLVDPATWRRFDRDAAGPGHRSCAS